MGTERSIDGTDMESYPLHEPEERTVSAPLPQRVEQEISEDTARVAVLHAMLEGKSGPVAIHKHTLLPTPLIERILNSPEIADMFTKAKQNFTQSAIDRLTGNVHKNIAILERLGDNQDPRVRMEAARDQLNRTPGLAPGAKVEIGTEAYKQAASKYFKPVDEDK